MGTISEKLTYLNGTKQLLKDKINNLGGSIDDNTTFRQYANQLQNVYDNLPKTSYQEGTEVTLSNTLKGKLDYDNGVVGIGQCEQNGEPTPSTPITINSVTGNQDVVVSGKNIFNPDVTGLFKFGCNATESNGEITITATQNGDIYVGNARASGDSYETQRGVKIPVKPNTQYTVTSTNSSINKIIITEYNSNDISLGYIQNTIITTKANTSYITVRYGLENAVNGTTYKTKIMVAEGTDTTYEPYITPTTHQLSLGDIQLNAIGNYKDELVYDVDEDKVYKNEKIGKLVLTGSEDWEFYPNISGSTLLRIIFNGYIRNQSVYCNYYKGLPNQTDRENFNIYLRNDQEKLDILDNRFTAVSDFKTWLSTHNTEVRYVKATPTLTELTGETLHAQVKALYNAHSLNGTTIITSNGNLPMIIKVRGLKGE